MVKDDSKTDLPALLLEHIGRYRVSFKPLMNRVYGHLGDVEKALNKLQRDRLVVALTSGKIPQNSKKQKESVSYTSIFGKVVPYQVTAKGAEKTGKTPHRAKKLAVSNLEISCRVVWVCCMGETRYSLLEEFHLEQLVGDPLRSRYCPYVLELGGKKRLYLVRLIGQNSKNAYALGKTQEDLLACSDIPGVREFCEHGRYGNLLVVSKPERRKLLEQEINRNGLKELGHVRVAMAPDLAEMREALSDR